MGTRRRPAPRGGARTAAVLAGFHTANRDLGLFAEDGFFKLKSQIVADVAALLHARGTPAVSAHVEHFAKEVAKEFAKGVASNSGGSAVFLDASHLWGTDASAAKAQRSSDGIHNCQQGAAEFASWFTKQLGKREGFAPASVDAWANGSWTGDDRYGKLKCDS